MSAVGVFLSRALRWVWRFRKRRGYGVHSPFAFNLITGVFFEKGTYYAYAPLREWRKNFPATTLERNDRLLFRLINEHQPRTGLIIGEAAEVPTEYLKAGCRTCKFAVQQAVSASLKSGATANSGGSTLSESEGFGGDSVFDFCYIHKPELLEEALPAVLPRLSERALLIANGIYATKSARTVWKSFVADEKVRVSFDLYELGLAYTEARLNKQDYVINYP